MTVPFTLSAAPSTVAAACHEVRRTLSQNLNDELVFVSSDYTPGDSLLRLRSLPKRLGPGSVLSAGLSTLYITEVPTTSTEVEVLAGFDGGPDTALAAGTPMRLNPRFTDYTIFTAVASSVAGMASPAHGLYGVQVDTFVGMKTDDFYPIPAAYASRVVKVLRVMQRSGMAHDWTAVPLDSYTVSLTPGNQHVRIFTEALEYQVVYAVDIRKPQAFTDDLIADCGLSETMLDIPALGASSVLMSGQEARRVNQRAQGDPRRAEDVPITGATGAARDLRRVYEQRIDEEYTRLVTRFPLKVA